jgi:Mn-dependent DtxR family transcriptional regulator
MLKKMNRLTEKDEILLYGISTRQKARLKKLLAYHIGLDSPESYASADSLTREIVDILIPKIFKILKVPTK